MGRWQRRVPRACDDEPQAGQQRSLGAARAAPRRPLFGAGSVLLAEKGNDQGKRQKEKQHVGSESVFIVFFCYAPSCTALDKLWVSPMAPLHSP